MIRANIKCNFYNKNYLTNIFSKLFFLKNPTPIYIITLHINIIIKNKISIQGRDLLNNRKYSSEKRAVPSHTAFFEN